jgi:hypothetical protein
MSDKQRYILRKITVDNGILHAKEWTLRNIPMHDRWDYEDMMTTISQTADLIAKIDE